MLFSLATFTPVRNQVAKVFVRKVKNGRFLVKKGQIIEPHQIIGEVRKILGFRRLQLAKILKVKPKLVERFLTKTLGSFIFKGDLIARRPLFGGLRKIEVFAPMDGVLKNLNTQTGEALLEYLPEKRRVVAGVWGKVVLVQSSQIALQTVASEINGKLGLGKIREGGLVFFDNPEIPIPLSFISEELTGKIICGGSLLNKEVLFKSLAIKARGLVCGGIDFDLWREISGMRGSLEDIGLTILVTEGFGNLPLNPWVGKVLQNEQDRYALIFGAKKKLLIPQPFKIVKQKRIGLKFKTKTRVPQVGDTVRVLNFDNFGRFGKIVELIESFQADSGLSDQGAKVEVGNKTIEVFLRNLEIMEV